MINEVFGVDVFNLQMFEGESAIGIYEIQKGLACFPADGLLLLAGRDLGGREVRYGRQEEEEE